MSKALLGSKVRDVVTGFTGIATGVADYIAGCQQICVSPTVGKDGKVPDAGWFDVERIEVVGTTKVAVKSTRTGGPGNSSEQAPAR